MWDKNKSFEYLLLKLHSWFVEVNGAQQNNISVLKALKLLFLVTAADIEIKGNVTNDQLLINTTFDKFQARPLGHVESDIYSFIVGNKGNLNYFQIDKFGLIKKDIDFNNYENIDKVRIDNSVTYLREKYPELINKEPYELVDLTHKWDSWRFFYSGKEKTSYLIPASIIIEEVKYFR